MAATLTFQILKMYEKHLKNQKVFKLNCLSLYKDSVEFFFSFYLKIWLRYALCKSRVADIVKKYDFSPVIALAFIYWSGGDWARARTVHTKVMIVFVGQRRPSFFKIAVTYKVWIKIHVGKRKIENVFTFTWTDLTQEFLVSLASIFENCRDILVRHSRAADFFYNQVLFLWELKYVVSSNWTNIDTM